jgi:hypothetical protein
MDNIPASSHETLRLNLNPKTKKKKKPNSVALERERNISTEQPPLVGEVSANTCRQRVSRGQLNVYPRPYSRLSKLEPED